MSTEDTKVLDALPPLRQWIVHSESVDVLFSAHTFSADNGVIYFHTFALDWLEGQRVAVEYVRRAFRTC